MKAAPVFAFTVLANGCEELVTFLLPEVAGASQKPKVREIEALNGRAFEISGEGFHDVLLLRDSEEVPIETARFVSDFDMTWVRFDKRDSRTLEELIVINGYTLLFEGRTLVSSSERIRHRFTRMNANQLCAELTE